MLCNSQVNICYSLQSEQSFASSFVQFNSSCYLFKSMSCNVGWPNLKNSWINHVWLSFLFSLSLFPSGLIAHTLIMQHWIVCVLLLFLVFCDVSTQRKKKTVQTLSRGISELHTYKQTQISPFWSNAMENWSQKNVKISFRLGRWHHLGSDVWRRTV